MDTKVSILVKYIAVALNVHGDTQNWDRFVHALEATSMIRRLNAKINKQDFQHETDMCEEFMKCWIREKPKSVDKVKLIMDALEKSGFDGLKDSAEEFIKLFDGNGVLSDSSLIQMAEKIGAEWESLGICLGLTSTEIEHIKMDNGSVRLRIYYMLNAWRMSDHAIGLGQNIVSELLEAMTVVGCDSDLIDFILSKSDPWNRI